MSGWVKSERDSRYLKQQDHVCFGELLAVQSACSQTHHGHVADSRVSICYTGQDLAKRETDFNQLLFDIENMIVMFD